MRDYLVNQSGQLLWVLANGTNESLVISSGRTYPHVGLEEFHIIRLHTSSKFMGDELVPRVIVVRHRVKLQD